MKCIRFSDKIIDLEDPWKEFCEKQANMDVSFLYLRQHIEELRELILCDRKNILEARP